MALARRNPALRSGRSLRRAAALSAALALTLGLAAMARAQEIDPRKAAGVRAGMLYHFTKFVTWPEQCFADADAPVVIALVGDDPHWPIIERSLVDKTTRGRPVIVRRLRARRTAPNEDDRGDDAVPLPPAAELRGCHLLYVCASHRQAWPRIRRLVEGHSVLTVSEVERFAEEGGMIELTLREGRYAMRINRHVAEKTGLELSARLLQLATIVEDRVSAADPDEGRGSADGEGPRP